MYRKNKNLYTNPTTNYVYIQNTPMQKQVIVAYAIAGSKYCFYGACLGRNYVFVFVFLLKNISLFADRKMTDLQRDYLICYWHKTRKTYGSAGKYVDEASLESYKVLPPPRSLPPPT